MSAAPPAGLCFDVAAWATWVQESWSYSDPPADAADPEKVLPAQLRRRITSLGRKALAAAWTLRPSAEARFIFCSRHGEYARTNGILDSLAREGAVSPAEFSMSVHHALAGLLSIATGNRAGHTAIAAGRDSFGYGLLEAAACLAEEPDRQVVVVAYDEPLPESYAGVADRDEVAAVVALTLRAGNSITITAGAAEAQPPSPSLAADFAAFLASSSNAARARGGRMEWSWHRAG